MSRSAKIVEQYDYFRVPFGEIDNSVEITKETALNLLLDYEESGDIELLELITMNDVTLLIRPHPDRW